MASAPQSIRKKPRKGTPAPSRYDKKLAQILKHATRMFCEKGYEGASMRDLSRASGVSLAGLYYYFDSKEKLLYLIQKHTFSTVVERLRQRLKGVSDPEQRLRVFIHNHLEYFLANQEGMKVLSHEDDALKNGYGHEIHAIKREYYRICQGLVDDLVSQNRSQSRIAVLSLFGMMNWIYTWHTPRVDADAGALSRQMSDIFLKGILSSNPSRGAAAEKNSKSRKELSRNGNHNPTRKR